MKAVWSWAQEDHSKKNKVQHKTLFYKKPMYELKILNINLLFILT